MRAAFGDFEEMVNGRARKNAKPETFTAADLMAQAPPPVRWAVEGLIPEGVTLLAGKAKMGKS